MRNEICPQDTCRLREVDYWHQRAEQAETQLASYDAENKKLYDSARAALQRGDDFEARLAEIVGVANVYSSIARESDESDAEYMVRASAAWKAVEAAVTKAEAALVGVKNDV